MRENGNTDMKNRQISLTLCSNVSINATSKSIEQWAFCGRV